MAELTSRIRCGVWLAASRRVRAGRQVVPALLVSLIVRGPVASQGANANQAEDREYDIAHDEAFRRAQVWLRPDIPIEDMKLEVNPEGLDMHERSISCRFHPGGVSGSTPKFDCELESGGRVKVKYGRNNPEVYTEVIATRLLAALGFPADRLYVVDRVRCYGCPKDPFASLQCVNEGHSIDACFPSLDYAKYVEFDAAVIERPIKGRRIETSRRRGWNWEELRKIDPAVGGASRAHVDAFRLMAVFLNHWDNKNENQRLLCLGEEDPPGQLLSSGPCERPVAMIQDLGATFGPEKLDLQHWARSPIWVDPNTCSVSMRTMPDGGSTFPDARISEEGRQFLADRLQRLSPKQIRDLFEGARVSQYLGGTSDVNQWISAFQNRIRAITSAGPCLR